MTWHLITWPNSLVGYLRSGLEMPEVLPLLGSGNENNSRPGLSSRSKMWRFAILYINNVSVISPNELLTKCFVFDIHSHQRAAQRNVIFIFSSAWESFSPDALLSFWPDSCVYQCISDLFFTAADTQPPQQCPGASTDGMSLGVLSPHWHMDWISFCCYFVVWL